MAVALTSACDDGRIYPDSSTPTQREGLTMKLTGHLTGTNSWAEGYTVAVAAFDDESVLGLMLDTNLTSTWGYDHQRADISDTWRKILKDWIENIEQ